MYPPPPGNRKNRDRSMFRASEPEVRTATSECFQKQADEALSSVTSKPNKSNTSDGLPSMTITDDQALTVSGCSSALKDMNTDTDQVKQMIALNATPELFQELKDQAPDQAADLAVRDSRFQTQALHDMDDKVFAENVRSRIT